MEDNLKKAINEYQRKQNQNTFMRVCEILRDSHVWIPCNTVMSEADQKRFDEMIASVGDDLDQLVGMDFVTQEETRLIPDVLKNGEALFFPVFSRAEEMGEYGKNFSKVEYPFQDALAMAKGREQLFGIVVNAFTEPFVLERRLFELMTISE